MRACDRCNKVKAVICYLSLTKKLCPTCKRKEEKAIQGVLKKLPDEVPPVPAPQGFNQVSGVYCFSQKTGEKLVEDLYKSTPEGAVN